MLYRLAASLGTIVLVAALARAGEDAPQQLWCPHSRVIDLAYCTPSTPEDPSGWMPILRRGACLGEPGKREKNLQCVIFELGDTERNVPLQGECTTTSTAGDVTVRAMELLRAGTVFVPAWADETIVSCPGLADVRLHPDSEDRKVEVVKGREVIVTLIAAATERHHSSDSQNHEQVHMTLRAIGSEDAHEKLAALAEPTTLGSVPLSRYTLAARMKGFAPVIVEVEVTPAAEPLELEYRLEPARCLPVHVICEACDASAIQYSLKRLSETKAPIAYAEGRLELISDSGGRLTGEICGIGNGRYDLTLTGSAVVPKSQPVQTGPNQTHVAFHLRSGVSSRVTLVDTDGLPVSGAEALAYWRIDGQPQQARTTSDAQGDVPLPLLPPETVFRVRINQEDYVPHELEGLAGDDRVVLLTPAGGITARIVGDGCAPDALVSATVTRRVEDGYGHRGDGGPYSPEDCFFNIPVQRAGTYDITFSGPEFIADHETVDLAESERIHLGDIELKRGGTFRVQVLHDGSPVPGALVKIGREGTPVVTDESGEAVFHCLSEQHQLGDPIDFFVEAPSFAPRHVLRPVEPDDVVEVSLTAGAEVHGVVLGEDGSPAVGETVYAAIPGGHAFSATVAGNGEYRIPRLEPGTWLIWRMQTFSSYGAVGTGFVTGDSRAVSLAEGDRREVDFEPAAEIRGRVSIAGQPVDHPLSFGAVQLGSDGAATTPIHADESGMYAARLPRHGLWRFFYGQLSYAQQIAGCPCVVDIDFTGP